MTVLEQRFMEAVPHLLDEIAKQLKIANNLKALELKNKRDSDIMRDIMPEMVDNALRGK